MFLRDSLDLAPVSLLANPQLETPFWYPENHRNISAARGTTIFEFGQGQHRYEELFLRVIFRHEKGIESIRRLTQQYYLSGITSLKLS